MKCYVSTLRCI